ncbi:MAG: ATPase [Gammaproteobacteria bacterium]|nr:ATPase [Gammaproteobacteria bacterium]
MAELTPTRTTYLEIQDELRQLDEGYRFLDEKSVLLAHEILSQLALYETNIEDLRTATARSVDALAATVARHGLDVTEVQPPTNLAELQPDLTRTRFLGLELIAQAWPEQRPEPSFTAVDPSPEADDCRDAFARLVELHFAQAVLAANLLRLRDEYVRTERRARALDQLIMPEMKQTLKQIDDQLESVDQEEASRVRYAANLMEQRGQT